jgi:hypothetical protein
MSSDRATGAPLEHRITQLMVEHALHAHDAAPIQIGIAQHMRGERDLRIKPLRLRIIRHRRFAQRIHLRHQFRQRAAAEIDERLA